MAFIGGVAVGLTLGVVFAALIKAFLHKQESQIGAKLKADAAAAVQKVVPKIWIWPCCTATRGCATSTPGLWAEMRVVKGVRGRAPGATDHLAQGPLQRGRNDQRSSVVRGRLSPHAGEQRPVRHLAAQRLMTRCTIATARQSAPGMFPPIGRPTPMCPGKPARETRW